MNSTINPEGKVVWQKIVALYAQPDWPRSIWQTINTLVPYFLLFYLSMRSLESSFWLTLPLTLLTAGFLVRAFIIFHDCGHGSFFISQRANDLLGIVTGILAFTPYYDWRHEHAIHHATSGDLDRRGTGDVSTMTVQEYMNAPWWKKIGYRIMRNPFALFIIGPIFVFVIGERIPPAEGKREIASVWWTNLALAIIVTAMGLSFGWRNYLATQLLVAFFGTSAGVWLFYVQLNFHLGSKIPNYNLPKAYRENPIFHVQPLTLRSSFKCLKWRVYDETNHRLAGWDALRQSPITT